MSESKLVIVKRCDACKEINPAKTYSNPNASEVLCEKCFKKKYPNAKALQ